MAKAATSQRDVVITLELTEEEALYVYGALVQSSPSPADRFGTGDDHDPVYTALGRVLKDTHRWGDYVEHR